MGCIDSKRIAYTPGASAASDAPPPTSASCDDLDWVLHGDASSAPSFIMEKEVYAARSKIAEIAVKVQILLEGGWKDCTDDQTQQIVEHLGRGETQFVLHARGQNYSINFDDPEGAQQLNVSTGKKRKLRLLDSGDDAPVPEDSIMGGTRSFCSGGGGSVTGQVSCSTLGGPSRAGSGTALGGMMTPEVQQQLVYGPQSRRGGASDSPYKHLQADPHAQECFRKFEQNEARLCGEWAVFYHSYSFAALIYEVQAAVGSVLFRFRSQYSTLPRILVKDFAEIPDAPCLVERFKKEFATHKRDHHPSFRRVAVSAMCSLASTGPEACVAMVFVAGYSCKDLSFRNVLENLLESCYVPKGKVKELASNIIQLSEKHGLDVSQFGGKACQSGKAGHLMQIFVKRSLVDKLVYAAKPYGPIDEARMPISKWMDSNASTQEGQARVVAHPKYFMRADCVRMYIASADPTFHQNRQEFQKELVSLMGMILGKPDLRQKAANGIYGGSLPSWWSAEDQRYNEKF